jgi:hypothetical protein
VILMSEWLSGHMAAYNRSSAPDATGMVVWFIPDAEQGAIRLNKARAG